MTESKPKPAPIELENQIDTFFADLEKIRLSPEDTAEIATKEVLTRIPVRRPRRDEFIRCHSDPAMSLAVTIYVDRNEQDDVYFVAPSMRGALAEDLKPVLLQLAITRKGVLFIWPLTIPHISSMTDQQPDSQRFAGHPRHGNNSSSNSVLQRAE